MSSLCCLIFSRADARLCIIQRTVTNTTEREGLCYTSIMKKILLQVKPFQETLNAGMCGPASLKIVLAYYGVHKSEKELARLCQHSKKLGVTNEQMEQAARSLGFRVRSEE